MEIQPSVTHMYMNNHVHSAMQIIENIVPGSQSVPYPLGEDGGGHPEGEVVDPLHQSEDVLSSVSVLGLLPGLRGGGREGGREGGEGGKEGRREGGREGGRKGREGGREGGKDGGREGGRRREGGRGRGRERKRGRREVGTNGGKKEEGGMIS